jgi:hypothetical protein
MNAKPFYRLIRRNVYDEYMSPWDLPELDLSPEKADEVIDKIARLIVNSGLGTPAIMTLDMVKPMGPYVSTTGFILGYPFLPLIPGNWGFNIVSLFHDIQNVEKLIQRIETLMKEEDEANKLEKEKRKKENPEGKRSLRNLFKLNF